MPLAESIFDQLDLWLYVAFQGLLCLAPVVLGVWALIDYRRRRVHLFTPGV
jgi:hypothetical protein